MKRSRISYDEWKSILSKDVSTCMPYIINNSRNAIEVTAYSNRKKNYAHFLIGYII